MRLNFIGLDAGLLQGLTILSKTHDFTLGEGGADVFVRQIDEPRIQVRVLDGNRAELQYHERIHFFRALGILLENWRRAVSLAVESHQGPPLPTGKASVHGACSGSTGDLWETFLPAGTKQLETHIPAGEP